MPIPSIQPSQLTSFNLAKSYQALPRLVHSQYQSTPSHPNSKKRSFNHFHSPLLESTSLDKNFRPEIKSQPNSYLISQPIPKNFSHHFNTSQLTISSQGKSTFFQQYPFHTISSKDTSLQSKFYDDPEDKTSTDQSSIQQIDHINNQYQLSSSNILALKKKVQFNSKNTLLQNNKKQTYFSKRNQLKSKNPKSTSILKNSSRILNQSLSTETEKSYSVQNSLVIHRKNKNNFGNAPYSGNSATKQKYQKILKSLRSENSIQTNKKQTQEQKSSQTKRFSTETSTYFQVNLQQKLIESCRENQKTLKFSDQIFPAVYSSIFRIINAKNSNTQPKTNNQKGKQIEWMRISELYKGKKVKIFNNLTQNSTQIKIYKTQLKGKSYYQSDMVVGALNAIKNNRLLLYKIFGHQEELNPFGIYLVNIYVDNHWKYIIIDDFIPVIRVAAKHFYSFCNAIHNLQQDQSYLPAFLNVTYSYPQNSSNETLYLWPFLIEKAYASYYSCYDTLNYGKILDFLTQLCGIPYDVIKIPEISTSESFKHNVQYQKVVSRIKFLLLQKSMVALAYSDDQLPYVPLHYNQSYSNKNKQQLTYDDPLNNYEASQIQIQQLSSLFSQIYLFNTQQFQHTSYSHVYPIKNKQDHHYILFENSLIRQSTSIRTFQLQKHTTGFLSIRQKENRLHMKQQAQYLWVRVFLFSKLYHQEYQWIDASYTNKKSISFKISLPPGQYYLIVMPEWKQSHNREITIILDSDNQFINFQRKLLQRSQQIIEMGCMDFVQKIGQLHQISNVICSYTIVSKQVGIIIENICNERAKGQITVVRSIEGLKARRTILPINSEFYTQLNASDQNTVDKDSFSLAYSGQKPQIVYREVRKQFEIDIPALHSFTIVLKMIGGMDVKFFNAFKF